MTPLHIWIVSENASLRMGGEAAIPFRFFREFRKLGHTVTLLTHGRVRDELVKSLSPEELEDVVFFADTSFQRNVFKAGRRLPNALQESYVSALIRLQTEYQQRRYLLKTISPGGRDIVFQPTPISPKALTLTDIPDVPVFFGPLNGAMSYPPAFLDRTSRFAELLIRLGRFLSDPVHSHVLPAKGRAAGLFLSNPRTAKGLPRVSARVQVFQSYDATIDASRWRKVQRKVNTEANHFLYVGRLVDWKAVDILIKAAHCCGEKAKLTIVGDGPERSALEALAQSGKAQVEFKGYLGHDELTKIYETVTAFVLSSLREAGGNVCMEALAAGVPVIATKWGGPCDVVIDGVDGYLIEPLGEKTMIGGFAEAMEAIINDPERARQMGAAGRERVLNNFDWGQKALDYCDVFRAALENGGHWKEPSSMVCAHPAHRMAPQVAVAWNAADSTINRNFRAQSGK